MAMVSSVAVAPAWDLCMRPMTSCQVSQVQPGVIFQRVPMQARQSARVRGSGPAWAARLLMGGEAVTISSSDENFGRPRPFRRLEIVSLDAAMPFDYEAIQKQHLENQRRLKIGIVGFGNFGQFIARRILKHNHGVIALSRTDYGQVAKEMGVTFFRDADDFCEEHPDVVLLASSILSSQSVLRALPLQRLKRSTLFVDVLSVKEFPKNLFLQVLPPQFDILCTHPMFGPESGRASWEGLPFVFERVRISNAERCGRMLQIFEKEGCRMVEMTCEEHDRYAAGSQFVTHTVGRVLGKLQLESTPINTRGYETLLQLVDNTMGDSFDLYYGLFMYNVNATEQLHNLERAFDDVKKQLFHQLHDVLRAQLVDTSKRQVATPERTLTALPLPNSMSPDLGANGVMTRGTDQGDSSSFTPSIVANGIESTGCGGNGVVEQEHIDSKVVVEKQ